MDDEKFSEAFVRTFAEEELFPCVPVARVTAEDLNEGKKKRKLT